MVSPHAAGLRRNPPRGVSAETTVKHRRGATLHCPYTHPPVVRSARRHLTGATRAGAVGCGELNAVDAAVAGTSARRLTVRIYLIEHLNLRHSGRGDRRRVARSVGRVVHSYREHQRHETPFHVPLRAPFAVVVCNERKGILHKALRASPTTCFRFRSHPFTSTRVIVSRARDG